MSAREYLYKAFCDNGTPSSSRLLTAATTLSAIVALLSVVFKTWHMPDGATLLGLGGFASSPYAVNRASKMFGKDKDKDSDGGDGTTVIVKQ